MKSRLLIVVSAGAALTVSACATPEPARPDLVPTANPPEPMPDPLLVPQDPVPTTNPPKPSAEDPTQSTPTDNTELGVLREGEDENDTPVKPTETLPTWDQVESGHPKGATNPPIPVLVVTPDGDCFKDWTSPMAPRIAGQPHGDRVQRDCSEGCGTPIECPDKAAPLLADWRKSAE